MHAFPAEIPEAEAHRSDVVEVRVARKVAPLFGLGADIAPFRRSWVCDFTALSLTEIGRGAPQPDRAARSRLEATLPSGGTGWAWSGRAVWSPQQGALPGTLSNATLNRYGPDTKAAVVLSAANRLLRAATGAVTAACRQLARSGCDPEVRLAVWAGLVVEVYRAQPALVVAAVQARQVQRSLSARWGDQVDRATAVDGDAPCEIHPAGDAAVGADTTDQRWQPTCFDLVDVTLPALGLADDGPAGQGLLTTDALDDVASAWCHRLLAVGRPGRGLVWLVEDEAGSRRVHAMVRVGALVAPFVAATLGGSTAGTTVSPPRLPTLPTGAALAAAPLFERRAHLLAAHVAASYLRYRDELLLRWPQLRTGTADLVAAAVADGTRVLDADDPVLLQIRAYAAYLDVWDRPRTPTGSTRKRSTETTSVQRLVTSQQRLVDAWRAGVLDPGAAAYLLEIGIVALSDAAGPAGATDFPTRAVTRQWWIALLQARGMDPETDLTAAVDTLSPAQVFHLHHYAAWWARGGRRADLRRALVLQERVTAVRDDVTRGEPAGFAAKSAAARAGHELAAAIAADLAEAIPAREGPARERAVSVAVRHARAVLADPSTKGMLLPAGPQPATVRAAQVVTRALCLAAAHGLPVDPADLADAARLCQAAIDDHTGWRPDRATLAEIRRWQKQADSDTGERAAS